MTARKARLPFLDLNQERDFGYAGMKELARTLENPIWPAVHRPAPRANPADAEVTRNLTKTACCKRLKPPVAS